MTKTALVTGGSRGIGKCVVDLLRAKGWEVIAPDRYLLSMDDVGHIGMYTRFLSGYLVGSGKTLDALIMCSGMWYSKPIESQFYTDWERLARQTINVNFLMVGLLDAMTRGGSVTCVSSTRGFIGGVETAPYSVMKAAQIALMQGYAREYQGVRFNCVAPGLTRTDMGQDVIKTGGAKPGAPMQPPEVVAAEIVRLIESEDNGRVMRVVNSEVTEAKWTW